MDTSNTQIERFLKGIEAGFKGLSPKTHWPLNGGQIDAYFDADESLDMYHRLVNLRKKLSINEIADIMPAPDVIRGFFQNNAIAGLKVAKVQGIEDISIEDRIKYVTLLFDIIKQKVKSDVFCLDGKNLLLDEHQVTTLLTRTKWDTPLSEAEKREIAFLTVSASNLCYTLYFDLFAAAGFYFHGPYDTSKKFGEGTTLIIRDYHDINPTELWPELEMPYKKLRIYAVYKNLYPEMNFVNHMITKTSIGDKLVAYKIYLDDKEIGMKDVPELIKVLHKVSSHQKKKIDAMPNLEKVKKGAEICYYMFRKLRQYMGDDWRPPKSIDENIKRFGDKFIKQFQYEKEPPLEHWIKFFDPRNDYF
jgi:hypothetical protein